MLIYHARMKCSQNKIEYYAKSIYVTVDLSGGAWLAISSNRIISNVKDRLQISDDPNDTKFRSDPLKIWSIY